jgi:LPS-assembly lipoprotein
MSWLDRRALSCRRFQVRAPFGRTLAALALVLAAASLLSGCGGIRPLYGPTASGQNLQAVMASVDVAPIPGRVGQRVRNELIFADTGGGNPAPSKYKLNITLTESLTRQLVQVSGESTSATYLLHAQYTLVNIADGKVLLTGYAVSQAPYDRFDNTFSNVRAEYDAQNRAAETVADSIKTRLAAYLATQA